jgi:hypothetical protein
MKDYSNLTILNDKKLRQIRNNINNRLESFKKGEDKVKALSPSHMLSGMDEAACLALQERIFKEMKKRSRA